jgi:hypothetical protein
VFGGVEMKYMLMFAGDEDYYTGFESFSKEKQKEALARVGKWWDEHAAAGRLLEGHGLQPTSTATTVRIQMPYAGDPDGPGKNGRALVTDGPFIDAKERIGGYAIIDVPDLDAAIAMAKSWPAGGTVEIRPLNDLRDV